MKKIIILLMLLPISLIGMQQETSPQSSNKYHVGIVTHILGSVYHKNVLHIVPCEEDTVVYEYDKETKQFGYIDRFTQSYLEPQPARVIQTMPDLSSLKHRMERIRFDASIALIDFKTTFVESISAHHERKLGLSVSPANFVLPIPFGQAAVVSDDIARWITTDRTFTPVFENRATATDITSLYRYSPALTLNDGLNCNRPRNDHIPVEAHLPSCPEDVTRLLKRPGSNILGTVIAFLSLVRIDEKTYVPSPRDADLAELVARNYCSRQELKDNDNGKDNNADDDDDDSHDSGY